MTIGVTMRPYAGRLEPQRVQFDHLHLARKLLGRLFGLLFGPHAVGAGWGGAKNLDLQHDSLLLLDLSSEIEPHDSACISAVAIIELTSAWRGTRPEETTCSSITKPGVPRIS